MILDEIIENKEKEVFVLKQNNPDFSLKAKRQSLICDFKSSLKKEGEIALIAEIKQASPSSGIIIENFDPISIAKEYQKSKAAAISVLTDKKYFNGSLEILKKVKESVFLPVLRKDFIIDEIQVLDSYLSGADAILLIARILGQNKLKSLYKKAKEAGVSILVETHDEKDVEKALSLDCDIIGINNRNLDTLKVDFETSLALAIKFPELKSKILVSESGIHSKNQINELKSAGFNAVLIGESLLKSQNIANKIKTLFS